MRNSMMVILVSYHGYKIETGKQVSFRIFYFKSSKKYNYSTISRKGFTLNKKNSKTKKLLPKIFFTKE